MLKGKTALITGSTSGIGLGIAIALAKQNANIIVNGLGDPDDISAICAEIQDLTPKGTVTFLDADMSKPQAIQLMMEEAERLFKGVDILVNNVGIQFVNPLETFPEEKWNAIIAINLSSAFHTTKAVIPHMRKQKWGRIINMSSAHGLVASRDKSAYVTAKHGLVGLTKVTALEGGKDGITCNAICPGFTWTPLVEKQLKSLAETRKMSEQEVIDKVILADTATGKFTTVEQLADLSVFLCSPAGDNLTGTTIVVDGGWTAH